MSYGTQMKEKQSLIRLNRNSCRNREMSRSREKNLFQCFLTKIIIKKAFVSIIISIFIAKLKPPSLSLPPSSSVVQVSALSFLNVKGPLVVFQLDNTVSYHGGLLGSVWKQKGSIAGSISEVWTHKSELFHPWRDPILNHERHPIWNYRSASTLYSLSASFHTCSLTIYYINLDSCETWSKFGLDPNGLKRRSLDPSKSSRCALSFESGCGSKITSSLCIYLNKEA